MTPCNAWALMTNHGHLLLPTGTVSVASIMRRLLTGYAVRFNRRHRRHGHLFQNRYKSIRAIHVALGLSEPETSQHWNNVPSAPQTGTA